MKTKKTDKKMQKKIVVETIEKRIGSRGKTFEGIVIKKLQKRLTIELERMIYIKKYERYAKSRTRIHARLPENMEREINIGDLIQVQECRPLSKIIHFIVIKKIKSAEDVKKWNQIKSGGQFKWKQIKYFQSFK